LFYTLHLAVVGYCPSVASPGSTCCRAGYATDG